MKPSEFKRWEIYKAYLDPVIGSEQSKTRPVLIISENEINALLNIINVLPLTTRKEGRIIYPNEVLLSSGKYGISNESIVVFHQIRTIDKQRLGVLYGSIPDPDKQEEIIEALCFQLGINIY